jgi:SSS family solute:Na+ symporter
VNLTLALLIGYAIGLTAIGLWIARLVRGSSDFFVAGRRLSVPLLFSTILAANIGAGTTIGATGQAYLDGISAWWWNGSVAIGSLLLAFVIGPRIWALAKAHNFYTVGDFLEWRYSRSVRGIIGVLIWVGTLFILAGQLIAGSSILSVIAGVPRWGGALIGGIAMTTYFVAGGLLSSAWVNLVQLVVLLGGFLVAVPIIVSAAGGFEAIGNVAAATPGYADIWYSTGPLSGWTFLFLLGPNFVLSPGLVQKVYGAADARTVRIGVGVQALAIALFSFLPVLIGMSARVLYPDLMVRDEVLPRVFAEHLPPLLSALGLAAVFSAEVSTCDAILFMLSTSLSQDLYKRFLNPTADDRTLLRVARLAAVAGGAMGIVLAIQLESVIVALSTFYTLLAVSLFVPVLGGLYVRRAGTPEALAAIVAGVGFVLAVQVSGQAGRAVWTNPNVGGLAAAALAFGIVLMFRRPGRKGSEVLAESP